MAFLHPHALLFAGLIGVLVALYLRDRYRPLVKIPSFLLWEGVPVAPLGSSRFRPDSLFLLQLALLSLLILGLADPYVAGSPQRGEPSRYVFVLDTSASMQAREGQGTRFEAARDALRDRLERLRPQDEAMLITAAQSPSVVSGFTRNHGRLIHKLARIEAVDTATNLELALAVAEHTLADTGEGVHVEVFTDQPQPTGLSPDWRGRVTFRQFGTTDDNVAIENLEVSQGRFQEADDARARLIVRNFSGREKHGSLAISLDDEVIARRGFSLPEHGERAFSFARFPAPGLLRAEIDVDDALSVDNRAYAWIRPERPVSFLVVSASERLRADLERIADASPNLALRATTPEELRGGEVKNADVVLFDHDTPDIAPPGATLYVFPEQGSGWLASRGVAENVEILDWNERHPVLAALRPELPFPLQRSQEIELPAWAEPLLMTRRDGREFPLAFCGEHDGRRVAVLAFDLDAEGLLHSDRLNLLLFFLNVLEWLAPETDEVRVLGTGASVLVANAPDPTARATDPRGRTLLPDDRGSVRFDASLAGGYRIDTAGRTRFVYANLEDARESDIGRKPADDRRGENAGAAHRPEAARASPGPDAGFGRWLFALAAGLLVAEWVVGTRRT